MNTQVTTQIQPRVAVINGAIKTTSIVVAEHFGKIHRDVVRAVENIECSDDFRLRNFAQSSFEADMPNGGKRQHKMYEMTKDGFTFLAMGFTGKEAAKWKEAYINAFNAMAEQLQNLQQLPEPKTQKALPNGLTLEMQDCVKSLVKERVAALPKEKQGAAAVKCWSSIKKKYGKTYKEVEPEHFSSIISLLGRLPLEGELLPKETTNTLTIDLDLPEGVKKMVLSFNSNPIRGGRWTMWHAGDMLVIKPMADDEFVTSSANLPKYISDGMGGAVNSKDLLAIMKAATDRMAAMQR